MCTKQNMRLCFLAAIFWIGMSMCKAQDTTLYVDPYFKIALNKQKWEYMPFGDIESTFKISFRLNVNSIFNDSNWRLRGLKDSKLDWQISSSSDLLDTLDVMNEDQFRSPWSSVEPAFYYHGVKIERVSYDIAKFLDVAPNKRDEDIFMMKHYAPYNFISIASIQKEKYTLSLSLMGYQKDSSMLVMELKSVIDKLEYTTPAEIDKALALPDVHEINAKLLGERRVQGIKYFRDFPNDFRKSKNYLLEFFYRNMVKQLTLDLLKPVSKNEISMDDVASKWVEKSIQDSVNFNAYMDSMYTELKGLKSRFGEQYYINYEGQSMTCDDIISSKNIDEVIKLGNQYIVELYDKYHIDSLADYNLSENTNYLNILPCIYPKDFSYEKYYQYADSMKNGWLSGDFYLGIEEKDDRYKFLTKDDNITKISVHEARNDGFQKYISSLMTSLPYAPKLLNIVYQDNPYSGRRYDYYNSNRVKDVIVSARNAVETATASTIRGNENETDEEEDIEYLIATSADHPSLYSFYPNATYHLNYLKIGKDKKVTHTYTPLILEDLRDTASLEISSVYFNKKAISNKQVNLLNLFYIHRTKNWVEDSDREYITFDRYMVFHDMNKNLAYQYLAYPSEMHNQYYIILDGASLDMNGCGEDATVELNPGDAMISNSKLKSDRLIKLNELLDKFKTEQDVEMQDSEKEMLDPFEFSQYKSYEDYYSKLIGGMKIQQYGSIVNLTGEKIDIISNLIEEESKNIPPHLRLYQSQPTVDDLDLDGNLEVYIVSISNGSIRYSSALTLKDNKLQPFNPANLNDLIFKTQLAKEMIKRSQDSYEPRIGRSNRYYRE